jgi:uncharacterized protein (TIGR02145 family)
MKSFQFFLMLLILEMNLLAQPEKIDIDGAISISNSESDNPRTGTIRWTGSDFEGWNGIIWVSLTGGTTVGILIDLSGNSYNTIAIGAQVWMAENLVTDRYNDSTLIDQLTNDALWQGASAGAWCYYGNDELNGPIYGKLYNMYAVNSGKLCPVDWHVPSHDDWQTLINHLGGAQKAGGPMKRQGIELWQSPNTGANNISGFSALPGGYRWFNGTFEGINLTGRWWDSTGPAPITNLSHANTTVTQAFMGPTWGLSIRCIQD